MNVPPIPRSLPRLPVGRSRGQSVVEFALVLPVLMLLLLIAIDFGRLFYTTIQLTNAAREGANVAASSPTNTAKILTRVRAEASSQGQRGEGTVAITTACTDAADAVIPCSQATLGNAASGNVITVGVTETFTFLTPIISSFFGGNLDVGASASAVVLGYAPGSGSNPGACPSPVASFTMIITDLTVDVNPFASTPNSGICNISGYNWDWGDGETSVGSATGSTHTYATNYNRTITLEVTNQGGRDEVFQVAVLGGGDPVICEKPTAAFTYTTGTGEDSKTYNFTDTSTVADPVNCPITQWIWDFGDSTYDNSGNASNPVHTYSNNRDHTVKLTVTNAGGSAEYSHTQ